MLMHASFLLVSKFWSSVKIGINTIIRLYNTNNWILEHGVVESYANDTVEKL